MQAAVLRLEHADMDWKWYHGRQSTAEPDDPSGRDQKFRSHIRMTIDQLKLCIFRAQYTCKVLLIKPVALMMRMHIILFTKASVVDKSKARMASKFGAA